MNAVKVDGELSSLYDGYFPDDAFDVRKRELAAEDSINAILALASGGVGAGGNLGSVLDVGAGDGLLSKAIHNRNIASKLTAVEISADGLAQIRALGLPIDVKQFDGYKIPFPDQTFDTAVCTHVVEHVEHERLFLREVGRVAKQAFFVVPLEGGLRGQIDRKMGHINYYTPLTFLNLVETGGFEIASSKVFACSAAYEKHLAGPLKGTIKSLMRSTAVTVLGKNAPHAMVCIMVVQCKPRAKGVL
jgi:ubiquinone/menaquinone biosynthesis C-methylase UbiE